MIVASKAKAPPYRMYMIPIFSRTLQILMSSLKRCYFPFKTLQVLMHSNHLFYRILLPGGVSHGLSLPIEAFIPGVVFLEFASQLHCLAIWRTKILSLVGHRVAGMSSRRVACASWFIPPRNRATFSLKGRASCRDVAGPPASPRQRIQRRTTCSGRTGIGRQERR